jgi:hypothetical protein
MFKKLTITGIVFAAIASAAPVQTQTTKIGDISVAVSPVFANFKGEKGENGTGFNVKIGNNQLILNYQNINGSFSKKEIEAENKYVFLMHQSIQTKNNDKKINNFIGIKYDYHLDFLTKIDDFDSQNSSSLAFLEAKAGISINNNNPFLLNASFNFLKKLTKNNLIVYVKVGATRYNFGTEFLASSGLAFNF